MQTDLQAASLTPYTGAFGRAQAQHLLRRTTFATDEARVNDAIALGLSGTIERLFSAAPDPGVPINRSDVGDPQVPVGSTWIDADGPRDRGAAGKRHTSLGIWLIGRYCGGGFHVAPRMSLFWHNHFGIACNKDTRAAYATQQRFWDLATGSFRQLVREMTIDFNMLKSLNGDISFVGSVNENFSRELLELFTLGKGVQVGAGDYTTYTETDVRAMANALTGWQTRNNNSREPGARPEVYFTPSRHDGSPRQLSHRFGGDILTVGGEGAYVEVVDRIFDHPLAAHHLCRKLYRFFVYYDITDEVEREIIGPMASRLRESDFVVAPVLRELLASEHFFEVSNFRALVKSPLDVVADVVFATGFPLPDDPIDYELILDTLLRHVDTEGMDLLTPDSVAGYEPWHIAPLYHRQWVTSPSLRHRQMLTAQIFGHGFVRNGTRYTSDLVTYIADIPDVDDPNVLVAVLCERFLGERLAPDDLDVFKEFLLNGLPDFEWSREYHHMLDHPDDGGLRESVERKLADTCRAFFVMPEIHLF